MDRRRGHILLGADGEPHTDEAVRWSLDLAIGLGLKLNAIHVRDPYLKQFYNEIYAQGREEYLDHVQDCLEEKARRASAAFEAAGAREVLAGQAAVLIKPNLVNASAFPVMTAAACCEAFCFPVGASGVFF